MTIAAIMAPLFAQVLLVIILAFLMAGRRVAATRANAVKPSALVGDASAWPKPALLAANAFKNQFEFPVLFYVLTLAAIVTKKADFAFVVMAWILVVTRYAHAFIHVTSNRMPQRFIAFIIGTLVLIIMWVRFAFQILAGG